MLENNKISKIKIECDKGLTKVYLDNKRVDNVNSIEFSADTDKCNGVVAKVKVGFILF